MKDEDVRLTTKLLTIFHMIYSFGIGHLNVEICLHNCRILIFWKYKGLIHPTHLNIN